ncbi:MAG: hypothetical protein QXG98_02385 [Candidatus Micrarchaeia archaeon]
MGEGGLALKKPQADQTLLDAIRDRLAAVAPENPLMEDALLAASYLKYGGKDPETLRKCEQIRDAYDREHGPDAFERLQESITDVKLEGPRIKIISDYGVTFIPPSVLPEEKAGEVKVTAEEVQQGQRALKDQLDSLKKTNPEAAKVLKEFIMKANGEAVSSLENLESSLKQGKINEEEFGRQANEALVTLNKTYQQLEEALADYARGEDARFNEMLSQYGLKLTDAQRTRLKQDPKIVSELAKTIAVARASLPPDGGSVPREEIEEIRKALGHEETKTAGEAVGGRGAAKGLRGVVIAPVTANQAKAVADEIAQKMTVEQAVKVVNKALQHGVITKQEAVNAIDAARKGPGALAAVLAPIIQRDHVGFGNVLKAVDPLLYISYVRAEEKAGIISKNDADSLVQQMELVRAAAEEQLKNTLKELEDKRAELTDKAKEGDKKAEEELKEIDAKIEKAESEEFVAQAISETLKIMEETGERSEEAIKNAVRDAIKRLLG